MGTTTENDTSPKRWYAIASRWVSVCSCGIIAGMAWWILSPLAVQWMEPVVSRIGRVSLWVLVSLTILVFLAAIWPSARGRWRGWLGLRHAHTSPPLWVAVAIGAWIATAPATYFVPLAICVLVPAIMGLALGTFSRWRRKRTSASAARSGDTDASGSERPADFDKIRKWLEDDREIDHPDRDEFGHDAVAKRIAARLSMASTQEAPTIAVVGPVGSGKTTIGRLVRHHLLHDERTVMVDVSLWPFDSPEAAVRGVLDAVVRALGSHVNTLSIRGLSSEYATAIELGGGRWSRLGAFLQGSGDPKSILDRMRTILVAIDLRIVLWIEDLERFAGAEELQGEQSVLRDAERLGPVRALLYLLDRSPSISVLIADTRLETRFDVQKIARFVERPPRLDFPAVWRIIDCIRDRCLTNHPESVIDSASKMCREDLVVGKSALVREALSRDPDSEPSSVEAIANLLASPRILKSCLRVVLETWENLFGEIDFDHVLAMTAIREARPSVFAVIDQHVHLFRTGFRLPDSREAKPEEHPVYRKFVERFSSELPEGDWRSVRALTMFVFASYPYGTFRTDYGHSYVGRPQGLDVDQHSDNWQRYMSASRVRTGMSDQSAMKTIHAWQNEEENDLVECMFHGQKGRTIRTFVRFFSGGDLCRLFEQVALREARERTKASLADEWATGIECCREMLLVVRADAPTLSGSLVRIFEEVVPRDLTLAYDVYCRFVHDLSGPSAGRFDEDKRDALLAVFHESLVRTFKPGRSEALKDALQGAPSGVLKYACVDLRPLGDQGDSDGPFVGWGGLSTTILELGKTYPEVGIPQILGLVTGSLKQKTLETRDETGKRQAIWSAEFDENEARRLFDFDSLISLLAAAQRDSVVDAELITRFDAAKGFALAYLARGRTASKNEEPPIVA